MSAKYSYVQWFPAANPPPLIQSVIVATKESLSPISGYYNEAEAKWHLNLGTEGSKQDRTVLAWCHFPDIPTFLHTDLDKWPQ